MPTNIDGYWVYGYYNYISFWAEMPYGWGCPEDDDDCLHINLSMNSTEEAIKKVLDNCASVEYAISKHKERISSYKESITRLEADIEGENNKIKSLEELSNVRK